MYEAHFGLKVKPFAVTPDPRFLYSSRSHREALASLVYGVKERLGFVRLVGEVGTGKPTLLRALLEGLDLSVRTVLITHTTVDREELVRMILNDLDMPCDKLSRVQRIQSLHDLVLLHSSPVFPRRSSSSTRPRTWRTTSSRRSASSPTSRWATPSWCR